MIAGRRVVLREVGPDDADFLYHLATTPESGDTWRFGGRTPSPAHLLAILETGTLSQYVVRRAADDHPIGLVQAYAADLDAGHARLSVAFDATVANRGWNFEGVALFVARLFTALPPLRKLYLEGRVAQMGPLVRSSGGVILQEGHLPDHIYVDGRHEDALIAAIYRAPFLDAWTAVVGPGILAERELALTPGPWTPAPTDGTDTAATGP